MTDKIEPYKPENPNPTGVVINEEFLRNIAGLLAMSVGAYVYSKLPKEEKPGFAVAWKDAVAALSPKAHSVVTNESTRRN